MKLSSYGMYENLRLDLIFDIMNDKKLNVDRVQLDNALLDPVISTIIETAFTYQQKLIKENSDLSIKERALRANKEAFATMLSTLSHALNIHEELLQLHVNKFISKAFDTFNNNIDFLMTLAIISKIAQREEMLHLYGELFVQTYPNLAKLLPFNDSQLLEEATRKVSKAINDQCPPHLQQMMQQHIKYMNEISLQKTADPVFAEDFKIETGMTIEQFRTKISLEKYAARETISFVNVGYFSNLNQTKKSKTIQHNHYLNKI